MPATKTKLISLRVSPEVRQLFEEAAVRDSRSLSSFLVIAGLGALPRDLQKKMRATGRGCVVEATSADALMSTTNRQSIKKRRKNDDDQGESAQVRAEKKSEGVD